MAASGVVARYGLIAIGIGAGVEGEPFALAGGVVARAEAVSLSLAIAAAVAGAVAVDQMWFLFSRTWRDHRLVRSIRRRAAFARSLKQIEDRSTGFILIFRFLYGVRAVAPVALGVSTVRYPRFLVLNLVSGCVWGALYTVIGYEFGDHVEAWYARAGPAAVGSALLIAVMGSIAAVVYLVRRKDAHGN